MIVAASTWQRLERRHRGADRDAKHTHACPMGFETGQLPDDELSKHRPPDEVSAVGQAADDGRQRHGSGLAARRLRPNEVRNRDGRPEVPAAQGPRGAQGPKVDDGRPQTGNVRPRGLRLRPSMRSPAGLGSQGPGFAGSQGRSRSQGPTNGRPQRGNVRPRSAGSGLQ